jgi:ABC-2 type transport system permease protein
MNNSFIQLFLANLRILFRNRGGLFWTIAMPAGLYIALSVLPIPTFGAMPQNYSDYVLPGIIAYTIMQGGIYGLAYWMVDLKTRGVIKRFLVTPIKIRELVSSVVAARLSVTIMQVAILTFLGMVLFNTTYEGNILVTLLLTVMGGGIFLLVGLLISNYSDSYETAAPFTATIGLPFAFLGNIFFPTESLPGFLQTLSKILPITYLADGLRQNYIPGSGVQPIGYDLFILAIWLLALLIFTISVFRLKE